MTKKEAKLKKEVNQLPEDHVLLFGGWKLTSININNIKTNF